MNLIKIGAFIATARREKKMTQSDLAKRIGVSDKAVSRWETGRGFPDVSILKSLSEELNLSINEIVNGEKIPPEKLGGKADNAILEALTYARSMSRKAFEIIALLLGIGLVMLPLLFSGQDRISAFPIIGVAFLVGTAISFFSKKEPSRAKNLTIYLTKRFAGVVSLAALAVILVLECLPAGVILIFADGPDTRITRTFSYFSLVPFGYAQFFPLITAMLTVVIAVFSAISFISNYRIVKLQDGAFTCSIVALITSVLSWAMFGADRITVIGIAISILLFISILSQAFSNRKTRS